MIVKVGFVDDAGEMYLFGQVDGRVYPPVRMPNTMTRFEVELEGIRRFLRRHQDWRYIGFEVDSHTADVLYHRTEPSPAVVQAANKVDYLIRRRPGPVFFGSRSRV